MTADGDNGAPAEHSIAVVVPVYRGEVTLRALVDELATLTLPHVSPDGYPFRVTEVNRPGFRRHFDQQPGASQEVKALHDELVQLDDGVEELETPR